MPPKPARGTAAAASYQSNSWRQVPPELAGALSFSSGFITPSSGLDPALKLQAGQRRAQGQPFVYGFVRLRVAPDDTLQRKLAGLGVRLLGPHDDHHKACLPVASLEAVAGLAEVEWVGVSPPAQKLSLELNDLRGGRADAARGEDAAPLPITINLFEADGNGSFRRELEAAGVTVGEYDPDLHFYRAVATWSTIGRIIALDFVLFVELIRPTSPGHDQSTPLIDADLIRPGGAWPQRFSGAPSTLGILDTGFMLGEAATVMHADLDKRGCGVNFTTDAAGVWNDQNGHGTHVLGTIAGTGTANDRYRGVAPGVGSTDPIRAAKIWTSGGSGSQAWLESALDFMASPSECGSPAPLVLNLSGGAAGTGLTGTDSTSRKLDDKVWTNRQLYVVAAGNEGPGIRTIRSPGVAKNALTVGNVLDNGFLTVGDIAAGSSRGPTGDGRMKPNLVGPGTTVTSARAGTTSDYAPASGTSMAAPHVSGLAATLMEHYSELRSNPALLRAHMMAAALAHDDVTGKSNDYGLGRVSGFIEHWAMPTADGWSTHWFSGTMSSTNWDYQDISVPAGAQRMVVVLTWDEPAASAGASRAVTYDVDLWVDHNADCHDPATGACGEYSSTSGIDNVEYVVVNNPLAGTYRVKASHFSVPSFPLPYGVAAIIIRGDPAPPMTASLTAPPSAVAGSTFAVTATIVSPSYVASGVQLALTSVPSGATLLDVQTVREDGVAMSFFGMGGALTLGNIVSGRGRSATWWFRADTVGAKTFTAQAWSENGGTIIATTAIQVDAAMPDLMETTATTNPPAPAAAPGTTLSVTDTVRNAGTGASGSSTTRYYLSLDGVKNPGDPLLTGTRAVPSLPPGALHSGTATVTIPMATPLNTYVLLACADDLHRVVEADETNNCAASSAIATVWVARPDLVELGVTTSPPAPAAAPGTTFSVTDTVRNAGAVGSGSSTTRYHLSLDGVKGAGDVLLTGTRAVPSLPPGAVHSGTVTVTVPAATPLNTYVLLACADDLHRVVEADELNNCAASSAIATVRVTRPDLVEDSLSVPPATKRRGTTISVTDTVRNAGAVGSGSSTTRYYLSLDGVKGAGDTLLTGTRAVSALAPGAVHSGTVTVTIPAATPLNAYVLLACADDLNRVVETNEANNCRPSSTMVTVTP